MSDLKADDMRDFFRLDDLAEEIQEHIAHRGNTDTVSLLWTGYLGSLLYADNLDLDDFLILLDRLKPVGRQEIRELFSKFLDEKEAFGHTDYFEMLIELSKSDKSFPPVVWDVINAEMRRVLQMPESKKQDKRGR